jgi:BirA family biotin operon repressor/biotin-[acetyl-CoA-carboxylase] ligase
METLFIGKTPIFLPQTDSTNSYAIGLLKNVNLNEGTVVHTAFQSSGKGQRGSSWTSEPLSNLAASIILKPSFLELKNHFYLYQIAALSCFDTLSELFDTRHFDVKIKWPNDILVNGRKICGILIENTVTGEHLKHSVIGVGMNLNQQQFSGLPNATSYKILTGESITEKQVLQSLCFHLEKNYLALKQGRFDFIRQRYLDHLYGLDQRLQFEFKSSVRQLLVKGVSLNGLLHLIDENGGNIEADVKEVKWMSGEEIL